MVVWIDCLFVGVLNFYNDLLIFFFSKNKFNWRVFEICMLLIMKWNGELMLLGLSVCLFDE